MAEAEPAPAALNWLEKRFLGLANYLSAGISRFVAFLFLLFALGAFFGAFVYTSHPKIGFFLIMVPAVLGLVAYYNRIAAIFLFAGFLIIMV